MIYLGADHRGFKLKEKIKKWLKKWEVEYEDLGNVNYEKKDDYVDFAEKVAEAVGLDKEAKGILICRSGVGMDIVANKVKKVRSVLGFNKKQVKMAVRDDQVNVLSLAANYISQYKAKCLVKAFLKAKPKMKKRYLRRIKKINKIEEALCC